MKTKIEIIFISILTYFYLEKSFHPSLPLLRNSPKRLQRKTAHLNDVAHGISVPLC